MWTPTTRAQHSRTGLRYGSDLTDAEWRLLSPFLPPPSCSGRHRKWEMREVVNAIFYALRGGCAWSLLPKCFPPWPTIYRWFARFRDDGTWETINHHLVMLDRERSGREASPTAAVIDSQSVKTTESGGVRGYDAGKKIKGRKRHAMVDTDGRALKLQAHSAAVQDRDGAGPLLLRLALALAIRRTQLRRWRVCWATGRQCQPNSHSGGPKGGWPRRLCRHCKALGCRALLCMDQPKQTVGKRLRGIHRIRGSLSLRGICYAAR